MTLGALCVAVGLAAAVPAEAPAPAAQREVGWWDQSILAGAYAGLYGTALAVGSQYGLESTFVVHRLETAYAYDLLGHVWVSQQIGELMGILHQRAGADAQSARRRGAWLGAFGALTTMEIINGFMPNVRFDPLDPLANALGAWLAAEGPRLVEAHPQLGRLSLQFGYRDWSEVFAAPDNGSHVDKLWHDYANSHIGVGVDVGPLRRPWASLLVTYGITSFELENMRNRFIVGAELLPLQWFDPWLRRIPYASPVVDLLQWADRRFIFPGLFIEFWRWDADPFSDREPFRGG